jgi:hypothetical protein
MQENLPPAHPFAEFGPIGRTLFHASRALAVFVSLTFAALVATWLVSIIGRERWSAPVPGFALLGAAELLCVAVPPAARGALSCLSSPRGRT